SDLADWDKEKNKSAGIAALRYLIEFTEQDYTAGSPSEPQNPQDAGKGVREVNHPLNQILYGPPGTGKTYNTVNHALAAIYGVKLPINREGYSDFVGKIVDKANEQFGVDFEN